MRPRLDDFRRGSLPAGLGYTSPPRRRWRPYGRPWPSRRAWGVSVVHFRPHGDDRLERESGAGCRPPRRIPTRTLDTSSRMGPRRQGPGRQRGRGGSPPAVRGRPHGRPDLAATGSGPGPSADLCRRDAARVNATAGWHASPAFGRRRPDDVTPTWIKPPGIAALGLPIRVLIPRSIGWSIRIAPGRAVYHSPRRDRRGTVAHVS